MSDKNDNAKNYSYFHSFVKFVT